MEFIFCKMFILTFYHINSLSLSLSLVFLMNLKLINFGGIYILWNVHIEFFLGLKWVFSRSCDRYYCFLVPLTLPVLVVAVYFHWLSMKMFKHAWFFLEPIRSGASLLTYTTLEEQVTKNCVYLLPLQDVLETFRFYNLPKYPCSFGLFPNILSNTCITGTFPYLHITHQLLILTIVMSIPPILP